MLLRCTQKFLTELRLKKADIVEPSADIHPLDEWYAHIFYLYPRRKCAAFMHARTKFCFWAFDRNRKELNDIQGLFRRGLGRALFDEHYPASVIKLFNERLENIQIGLSKNRKVLGFINRRVKDLQYMADYYPEDRRVHDEQLYGFDSRRCPMVREEMSYSIDHMKAVLSACPELEHEAISPMGHKHPELEKYFTALHAERKGQDVRE